jgi:hypothetical protein
MLLCNVKDVILLDALERLPYRIRFLAYNLHEIQEMEREWSFLEDLNSFETEEEIGIQDSFYRFYNRKAPSTRIRSSQKKEAHRV